MKRKINKQTKRFFDLFLRYLVILIAGLGNLFIFYKFFTPLTAKTVAFILNLFSKTTAVGDIITSQNLIIELIPACIAGSAFYLLFILIFATPNIVIKKRAQIVLFSFVSLFFLNILRIIILALMTESIYFEATHKIFWYGVSTIFVVGIWIFSVKIFKIKDVPGYTDLKFLVALIHKPIKKSKRRR